MCTATQIYELLREAYKSLNEEEFIAYYVCKGSGDIFKTLIATILSQNSTDKSAMIAYKNLEEKIGIEPKLLVNVKIEDIISAIRICGLSNSKARYIRNAAKAFLEHKLEFKDCDTFRNFLLSIKGVGYKTANVVLVTCLKCKAFPVDTHIKRVITRLGILGKSPSYKDISNYFLGFLESEDLLNLHHLLIHHGRRTCKARKPLCDSCVLKNCCEFYTGMAQPSSPQAT